MLFSTFLDIFRGNNEIEGENVDDNDYWLVFANRLFMLKYSA